MKEPNVGLLSSGEEAAKGNETTKKTFSMLQQSDLNFSGNVESRDLFGGKVDVAVCDGFVGNVVLKTSESVAKMISAMLQRLFRKSPVRMLGFLLSRGVFKEVKSHYDPSHHGGAPLLGANGVVIIGHGSSNATATYNAIRVAAQAIDHDLNHLIEAKLASINSKT